MYFEVTPGTSFPQGGIIMWSGAIADIPSGWALCDGTNGTPNLQDKFVVGAGSGYAVGATGGADTVNIEHSHSNPSTGSAGSHDHGGFTGSVSSVELYEGRASGAENTIWQHYHYISSGGAHAHTVGSSGLALSSTQENRPPYYALAFIMKV